MGGENVSYPILYESNATDFFNLGLGTLPDAISTLVTEERNGEFILEMSYPIDGTRADLIKNNRIIKTDAGHLLKNQRFVIKTVTPHMEPNGQTTIQVYVEHISYLANDLTLKPSVSAINMDAQSALNQWKNNIIDLNGFTVDSDIVTKTSTTWTIDKVQNARQALGGAEGSILDRWHGEYRFDNLHVSLLKARGTTANTLLAYGRNITDFQQEENIVNTYTSIYPYATLSSASGDEQLMYTLDDYVVDSDYVGNYPNRKTEPMDFSPEFENVKVGTKPTGDGADSSSTYLSVQQVKDKLKSLAQQYIKNNNIGIPTVSIKISFVDLSRTTNYADVATLEELDLCDNVPVRFSKLGINTTAKVSRVVWNVLTDSYDSLELGEISATLGDKLNEISDNTNQAKTEIDKWKNVVQTAANGINTVFRGPDTPIANHIGDLWYKPNGQDTEMYQWDGVTWVFIMSTKETSELKDLVEQTQKDVEITKQQANTAVDKSNTAEQSATQAIVNAEVVNQSLISLKAGSTATIAELANGLQTKVSNNDFATYRTQTDQAIQDRVTSVDFETRVTQLDNQITSIVSDSKTQDYNLVKNGTFNNGRVDNWTINSMNYTIHVPNGNQPFASDFIRFTPQNTGHFSQDINNPARLKSSNWNLNFWFLAESGATGHANVYLIVDKNDGTRLYAGNTQLPVSSQWKHYEISLKKEDLTDIKTAILRFNFENGSAGYWHLSQIQINPGLTAKPYTENTENMAVSSQITQLSNDINLRVSKGDVVNQINISPESILIDGKKVHITGQTSIDDAVITSAMIKDIKADKITTGTLNAANVNLINVNVSSLVGNTSNFVRSSWNAISSNVNIDGEGIKIGGGSGNIKLGRLGIDFIDTANGENLGEMHSNARQNNPATNGIMIGLNKGADYFALAQRENDNDPLAFKAVAEWHRSEFEKTTKGFHIYDDVNMHDNLFLLGNDKNTGIRFTTFGYNNAQYPALMIKSERTGILFGSEMLYAVVNGKVYSFGTWTS